MPGSIGTRGAAEDFKDILWGTPIDYWFDLSESGEDDDEKCTPPPSNIFPELPDPDDREPEKDKKLSKGDIRKLKKAGYDIHDLKGGKGASRFDLFKDKHGNVYMKPKSGAGPGDPLGINIKNL